MMPYHWLTSNYHPNCVQRTLQVHRQQHHQPRRQYRMWLIFDQNYKHDQSYSLLMFSYYLHCCANLLCLPSQYVTFDHVVTWTFQCVFRAKFSSVIVQSTSTSNGSQTCSYIISITSTMWQCMTMPTVHADYFDYHQRLNQRYHSNVLSDIVPLLLTCRHGRRAIINCINKASNVSLDRLLSSTSLLEYAHHLRLLCVKSNSTDWRCMMTRSTHRRARLGAQHTRSHNNA